MNASKWQTPYGLWQVKLGIVPKEDISKKKAVAFGKKLELFVITEILSEYNLDFAPGTEKCGLRAPLETA